MHAHKARAIHRRLVNAGLTPSDRVCMHARTRVSALAYITIRLRVYSCPSCVRDICHRKPHNGPSHHGSPIVHLCHIYVRASSLASLACIVHRAAMKPMHPASSVDTFDTKAFLSHSSLVTSTAGYQEINRRFVHIFDITSPNDTERVPPSASGISYSVAATPAISNLAFPVRCPSRIISGSFGVMNVRMIIKISCRRNKCSVHIMNKKKGH